MSANLHRAEPRSTREQLRSYGGDVATADIYHPESVDALRAALDIARRSRRRVTFRGGGCAFDTQSLNEDVVISLAGLRHIEVDRTAATVCVGPGTTWGDILDATVRDGLVPFVMVTARETTAGGTASSDCLSRFSPSFGKEGWHILSLELMTVDGRQLTCSRSQNSDVFYGVVGGLGYLGAVVSITYRLLPLWRDPKVATDVTRYQTIREFVRALVPEAHELNGQRKGQALPTAGAVSDVVPGRAARALYGGIYGRRALLFRSRYVEPQPLRPLPLLHQPRSPARVVLDLALRVQAINRIAWWVIMNVLYRRPQSYVDPLEDFTFFMDGNTAAKRVGLMLGFPMRVLQQTFIVPAPEHDSGEPASLTPAIERVTAFIESLQDEMSAAAILPTMFDVLFIPKDEPFMLSSSSPCSGYAVSAAFDSSNRRVLSGADTIFRRASRRCRDIGGRVHLVKNVRANPDDLEQMYTDRLDHFFALKRRLDPDQVLRNSFLERVFPDYVTR